MDGKPLGQQFSDDIFDVLEKYMNQGLTFAEVLGHLEYAKLAFFTTNMESDEEKNPWEK